MSLIDQLNEELLKVVKLVFKDLGKEFSDQDNDLVSFDISDTHEHGDFSTSCALKLSKKLNKKPAEIAELISAKLSISCIKKSEILGPGFLNIFLNMETKANKLKELIEKGPNYGKNKKNNKKILLEFVSSNPTGPLHVGHGRGAVLGMALSNLLEN